MRAKIWRNQKKIKIKMEFNIGKGIEFAWKKKAQIQQIL
jgi:hypothetical protein